MKISCYILEILLYHVVPGVWFSAGLTDGMSLPTLSGKNITINLSGSGIFFKVSNYHYDCFRFSYTEYLFCYNSKIKINHPI